jgi:hypothetical protein
LGELWSVHRERRALWTVRSGTLTVVGLGLALILCARGLLVPGIVLAVVTVAGLLWYVYLAPVSRSAPRRWFAVCAGGLVVSAPGSAPAAIRWPDVGLEAQIGRTASDYRLRYPDSSGTVQTTYFSHASGLAGLVDSIRARAPRPSSRVRPILVGVAVLAGAVLLVWFLVLPRYGTHHASTLPASVGQLYAACDTPGTAYRPAPAYTGAAPHPVVAFIDGSRVTDLTPEPSATWLPDNPNTVQLVACAKRVGTAGHGPLCRYPSAIDGQQNYLMGLAQFRLDVYELRTHRRIATATLVGTDTSCPHIYLGDQVSSRLTGSQLYTFLQPFVIR